MRAVLYTVLSFFLTPRKENATFQHDYLKRRMINNTPSESMSSSQIVKNEKRSTRNESTFLVLLLGIILMLLSQTSDPTDDSRKSVNLHQSQRLRQQVSHSSTALDDKQDLRVPIPWRFRHCWQPASMKRRALSLLVGKHRQGRSSIAGLRWLAEWPSRTSSQY